VNKLGLAQQQLKFISTRPNNDSEQLKRTWYLIKTESIQDIKWRVRSRHVDH